MVVRFIPYSKSTFLHQPRFFSSIQTHTMPAPAMDHGRAVYTVLKINFSSSTQIFFQYSNTHHASTCNGSWSSGLYRTQNRLFFINPDFFPVFKHTPCQHLQWIMVVRFIPYSKSTFLHQPRFFSSIQTHTMPALAMDHGRAVYTVLKIDFSSSTQIFFQYSNTHHASTCNGSWSCGLYRTQNQLFFINPDFFPVFKHTPCQHLQWIMVERFIPYSKSTFLHQPRFFSSIQTHTMPAPAIDHGHIDSTDAETYSQK